MVPDQGTIWSGTMIPDDQGSNYKEIHPAIMKKCTMMAIQMDKTEGWMDWQLPIFFDSAIAHWRIIKVSVCDSGTRRILLIIGTLRITPTVDWLMLWWCSVVTAWINGVGVDWGYTPHSKEWPSAENNCHWLADSNVYVSQSTWFLSLWMTS